MNFSSFNQTLPECLEDSLLERNETLFSFEQSSKNQSFVEVDPDFSDAYDSPTIKVISLIIYFLGLPMGCVLHFLVIHYEQFGGDPQKRSIYNQIISYTAALEILHWLVVEHIFVARVLFGCLPSEIATFNWFYKNLKNSMLVTFITIALTYRTIRVYSFRKVAGLNDNALSIFILLATFLNNFLYMITRYMLGEAEGNIGFKIMTCGQGVKNINFDERLVYHEMTFEFSIGILHF